MTFDGSTIHAHGWTRELEYPVSEAFELDGRIIVLFKSDARGERFGQFPNLIALGPDGERLWTAELPTTSSSDHYYRITSRRPLVAGAPSYECEIDPGTGRIVRREFLK